MLMDAGQTLLQLNFLFITAAPGPLSSILGIFGDGKVVLENSITIN